MTNEEVRKTIEHESTSVVSHTKIQPIRINEHIRNNGNQIEKWKAEITSIK